MQDKREFYKKENDKSAIKYGERGPRFTEFILRLVARGKLTEKYINILSSDDAMQVYKMAFTSASADPQNSYEILEQLGDVTCNKALLWYLHRRFFPSLAAKENVKILGRMKIVYASKNVFAPIAIRAGFFDFISAREEDIKYNYKSLCEDTLEAFFGATEHLLDKYIRQGVGGAICYTIFSSFMDEMVFETTFDKLLDNVTRLKELGDMHPAYMGSTIKEIKYDKQSQSKVDQYIVNITMQTSIILENGRKIPLSVGTGSELPEARANAALQGLQILKSYGIFKYTDFSEPHAVFKF